MDTSEIEAWMAPVRANGQVWQRTLSARFPNTHVRAQAPEVEGVFVAQRLGQSMIMSVRGAQHEITRQPAADLLSAWWGVVLQLDGVGELEHAGERARLMPGDAVVVDPRERIKLWLESAYHQALWLVPRAAISTLRVGSVWRCDDPIDRMLCTQIELLVSEAFRLDACGCRAADEACLALLRAGTASRTAAPLPQPVRVRWAIELIERELHDPTLNAARVADAQQVSRRHLDALFAACGTTLDAVIWRRRLERAADALRARPERTIMDVAMAHGFSDASHFARRFRACFGTSPSRWRRGSTSS